MFVSNISYPSFQARKDENRKSSALKFVLPVVAAMMPQSISTAVSTTLPDKDVFEKTEKTESIPYEAQANVLAEMKLEFSPRLISKIMSTQTITLDPGHGGKIPSSGNPVNGTKFKNPQDGKVYYEKDVNLAIAKKVKEYLEMFGAKVVMTRDSDDYVDLTDRALIAQKNNSDAFVSIHVNYNGVKRIKGSTVFKYMPEMQDGETKLRKVNNSKGNDLLAQAVDEGLSGLYKEKYGYKNTLGIQGNDFRVCREVNVKRERSPKIPAAVLIETGFFSNPDEAKLLISDEHQDKLAKAIARGLIKFSVENAPEDIKNNPADNYFDAASYFADVN